MTTTETITIRLDAADKVRLAQLAQETKRSKSFLAAQAIHAYVEQEAEIIAHIQAGLADMRAGRLISNAAAQEKAIKAIRKTKRKDP